MNSLSGNDPTYGGPPSRVGSSMTAQLSVTTEGGLIVARLRGEPTAELLRACQEQVLQLIAQGNPAKVLYDVQEMSPPHAQVPFVQRSLDEALHHVQLRRAIVVPDSRLALLARIAFGEGEYRVFYNDLEAAKAWLKEGRVGSN
jgi:hypothetical protein